MEIYNDLGFLLVGMFIGMVVFSLVSLFMFRKSTQSFTENETGVCWHQKEIARTPHGVTMYVLQSSKDCETLVLTRYERDARFYASCK